MAGDITLGVRLTADGRGFVGGVTVSEKALRKFTAGGRQGTFNQAPTAKAAAA